MPVKRLSTEPRIAKVTGIISEDFCSNLPWLELVQGQECTTNFRLFLKKMAQEKNCNYMKCLLKFYLVCYTSNYTRYMHTEVY